MKKSVAALGAFALGFVLVFQYLNAEAKAQTIDRNLSLRDLSPQLQTPQQISHYIWRHFSFESDRRQFGLKNYWQTPEELLDHKKGDCEDFALFAHSLMRMNSIPSFLLNVYGNGVGHTVAIFKQDGKYFVLDGPSLKAYDVDNLQELAGVIHPFWREGVLLSPNKTSTSGRVLQRFDRLVKAHRRVATSA